MARGWESKAIEEQQTASSLNAANRATGAQQPLTVAERQRQHQRDLLLLARTRVLQQLTESHNPVQKQQLEHALADLETRLKRLD